MSSAVACSSALVTDDAEMMRCVIRLRVGRDSYIDKHNALYCWWTRAPQRPATRISGEHVHIGCFSSSKRGQGFTAAVVGSFTNKPLSPKTTTWCVLGLSVYTSGGPD